MLENWLNPMKENGVDTIVLWMYSLSLSWKTNRKYYGEKILV